MAEEKAQENSPEEQVADSAEGSASEQTKMNPSLEMERGGIIGVKAGMTHVYNENGQSFAVTVVDIPSNVVTQIKTKEKDGYQAVQVGVLDKKDSRLKKPEKGRLMKAGIKNGGFYCYQEFRFTPEADLAPLAQGQILSAGFLKAGDFVDLYSVSKGKGFQGPMKRHNFGGGPKSHGASLVHRSGGSIGNSAGPGRVYKNTEMAGQMGNKKVTVQNVKVVEVNLDENYLLVHGSVPGAKSGLVTIRKAIKRN